ncbi:MAG: DUF4783 domain-containing protein [Niabella sp.]
MKKNLALFVLSIAIWGFINVNAQSIDGVINGLKAGNAVTVTANAGDNLLLTVTDKSGTYKNAQAQQILKDFFAKATVKGFDLKHKGNSPNGRYAIGTLSTANGNYRVIIFMKNENDKELIKELRFQLIE